MKSSYKTAKRCLKEVMFNVIYENSELVHRKTYRKVHEENMVIFWLGIYMFRGDNSFRLNMEGNVSAKKKIDIRRMCG